MNYTELDTRLVAKACQHDNNSFYPTYIGLLWSTNT